MLKKTFLALFIGIFVTIFFAQYDEWTHRKIILLLQKVAQEALDGDFSCTIQSVNFFAPSIVLNDVEMKSCNSDRWAWRCKKCEVTCSWIQLFYKGTMDQYVVIDEFECESRVKNFHLAIESHITAMMQESFLPFSTEIKSMAFKNASICINDESCDNQILLYFCSSSLRTDHRVKTSLSITDGRVIHHKNRYVESITADVFFITECIDGVYDMEAQVTGAFILSHIADQGVCYIAGKWKNNRGRFSVRNAYNSFIIDPIIITEREFRINAYLPLFYLARCITDSMNDRRVRGAARCSIKMGRDESYGVDGQIIVEDAAIDDFNLCDSGKVIFVRHQGDLRICGGISRYNQECKGTGYWHETAQKGEFSFKNTNTFFIKKLSHWQVGHDDFYLRAAIDKGEVHGTYGITAINVFNDEKRSSKGFFSYKNRALFAEGSIDAYQFLVNVAMTPGLALYCSYKNDENKQLISLQSAEEGKIFFGSISFPFVRSLINNVLKYDVQGEGSLDFVLKPSAKEIAADFELKDAAIRLPQTYNFIDGFRTHCIYTMSDNTAVLSDMNVSLHTGNINCLRAIVRFDNYGSLVFVHAPFIFDRCLLNIRKDLFAIVSGNLLFSKIVPSQSIACVSGNIVIDKAQLKENLFSNIVQKQLLSYTHSALCLPEERLKCDVAIETKLPISVDTGFLRTNAHITMNIKGGLHDPLVTGMVALRSGTLNFPYKPLHIVHGSILFSSDRLSDPFVELIARNKIKKYDISLQVEGSLSAHHITLDATPTLSEEQIVGLLLVGSQENSLNSMMPALIVQNLKNFIFSNNQTSFFDKYFKPLLGSLSINLIPSFSDQTGRGGLRGAVEINIDDRWRAAIQKNFSLTEDTKFELEFLASDDITLRAIRDERRDLGGEIEMRWKF